MTSSTRLGRAWKRSHRLCDQQIPSFVRTHAQLLYTVYNKDINNELPRRQIKRGQETRIIFLPTSSSSLRRRKGGFTDCIDRKKSSRWQVIQHAFDLGKSCPKAIGKREASRIWYIRIFSNGTKETILARWQTRGHGSWHGWSLESNIWTRGRVEMCQQRRGNGLVRTCGRIIRNLPRELYGGGDHGRLSPWKTALFPSLSSRRQMRGRERVNRKQPQTWRSARYLVAFTVSRNPRRWSLDPS